MKEENEEEQKNKKKRCLIGDKKFLLKDLTTFLHAKHIVAYLLKAEIVEPGQTAIAINHYVSTQQYQSHR
jgi:hypothetical protein